MRTPIPRFSLPLFGQIAEEWAAWKNGIPPSSQWGGLNAQNPRLLRAFAALDRAETRADKLLIDPEREREAPARNAAEMKARQSRLLGGRA